MKAGTPAHKLWLAQQAATTQKRILAKINLMDALNALSGQIDKFTAIYSGDPNALTLNAKLKRINSAIREVLP